MHVKVRHALRNADVDRDERAVRLQAAFNRLRESLNHHEKWTNLVGWKLLERLVVRAWNDQYVAGQQRAMIEKSSDVLVGVHEGRGSGARDDVAENAALHRVPLRRPTAPVRMSADSTWPPPISTEPASTPTARRVAA